MTDDPLGDRIARGKHAAQLLGDPFTEEILSEMERDLITEWSSTEPDQREARERCWNELRQVAKFRDKLKTVAANGRVAQGDLNRLIQAQE